MDENSGAGHGRPFSLLIWEGNSYLPLYL
jgi:hypothetical protein